MMLIAGLCSAWKCATTPPPKEKKPSYLGWSTQEQARHREELPRDGGDPEKKISELVCGPFFENNRQAEGLVSGSTLVSFHCDRVWSNETNGTKHKEEHVSACIKQMTALFDYCKQIENSKRK